MRFLSLVVILSFLSIPAFAGVKVSIVGSATKTEVKSSTGSFSPNGTGYGGGLLFGFSKGGKGDSSKGAHSAIELGFIYKIQKLQASIFNGTANDWFNFTVDAKTLEIPLMFRRHFLKILSFGIGGYYSKPLSTNASYVAKRAPTTTRTATVTSSSDYGAVASFAFDIPLKKRLGLLVDGRYNYGVGSAKTREPQILAGITLSY